MTKRQRIERDMTATTEKIQKLQEKLGQLQEERKKLLDMEILEAVHSVSVSPEELKALLHSIKMPNTIVPETELEKEDTNKKTDIKLFNEGVLHDEY